MSLGRNFLLAVLALLPGANALAGDPVKVDVVNLYTTKMGAYSNPDDKTNPGLFYELVNELGKRSNIVLKSQDLPWSRALKMTVQDKFPTLIFPLIRTPQRENDYSWPIRALVDRLVFFGLAGSPKIAKIQDFGRYRIGVIRGSPFEKELVSLAFANLDVATDATDNAKKLKHKRIDYWYVTYNTASYTFEQLGFPLSDFEVSHTTSESGVYIGANKSFPKDLTNRLEAAFKQAVTDGWYKKLLDKYHVEDAGGH